MMKRTKDEITAAIIAIQKLKSTQEYGIYEREVLRIKDAIASGAYKEKGEDLVKVVGVMHGIDVALNIDTLLQGSKI
jgi:anti-sigma28 factor (negative regulator of flagellin synthesis)